MTYSRSLFVLTCSIFALNACGHPSAMPKGFVNKEIQSPDATPATRMGDRDDNNAYTYTYIKSPRLSQVGVDKAVEELLRKITVRAGVSPKPVYILTPPETNGFYNVIDSSLRTNMRDLGYAISDTKKGAYAFSYSARKIRKTRGTENDGRPNVELTLRVFDSPDSNARMLTRQSGNYFIAGASDYDIYETKFEYDVTYDTPVIHDYEGKVYETAPSDDMMVLEPMPAPAVMPSEPAVTSDSLDPDIEIPKWENIEPPIKAEKPVEQTQEETITYDQNEKTIFNITDHGQPLTMQGSDIDSLYASQSDDIDAAFETEKYQPPPPLPETTSQTYDRGPIVPDIEFELLPETTESSGEVHNQNSSQKEPARPYGSRPTINQNSTLTSGRVSKKVQY